MRGGLAGQGPRGGMGGIDGRIIAGTNVTVSPASGVGNVTISAAGGGGAGAFTTITVTGAARFNGGVGINTAPAITGLHIIYDNDDPSAPGFILDSSQAVSGDAVAELRIQNATLAKWRVDSTGDVFMEAGKGFTFRVNTLGSFIPVFSVTNAGDVGLFGTPAFEFDVAKAKAGTLYSAVRNSRNVAGTDSTMLLLQVGGGTAGDPGIQFNVSGVSDWGMGVDNSDSDNFCLGVSATIGSALRMKVHSAAPTSGNTVVTVAYHNGTTATTGLVTLGAADSGGSGFKVLRVPN